MKDLWIEGYGVSPALTSLGDNHPLATRPQHTQLGDR